MRMKMPFAIPLMLCAAPASAGDITTLTYAVKHQLWGDIGKIRREIAAGAGEIRVTTEIDVRVSMLGVTLHDTHGRWREVWRSGFLHSLDAETRADGTLESVRAERDGGGLSVLAGGTRSSAPLEVQPANPWSPDIAHAQTLMSPETGRLFPAGVTDKGMETRVVSGTRMHLRHLVLDADGLHDLYFDPNGTLVQMAFSDITGRATISLAATAKRAFASGSVDD